jgi:hypothetical protein
MEYAFRVFAAIYDRPVVSNGEGPGAICCHYGENAPPSSPLFHIPSLYREDVLEGKKDPIRRSYAAEDIYLSCGLEASGRRPDWL